MPEVRIGSEIKTYPQGTAYAEIAEEYQKNYENDILLVSVNGRLRELHKTLQKDCQMEFITAADTAGGGGRQGNTQPGALRPCESGDEAPV